MTYIETWKVNLPNALERFQVQLKKKDTPLRDVLATSVLWTIREVETDDDAKQVVTDICGADKLMFIEVALRLLDNDNDHEIVKRVGSQMVALPDFLKAMNALYAEFVDVLVENDFLRKGDKAEAKVQKPMMQ